MLERYGEFPFYRPAEEIYRAVFGSDWKKIIEREGGYQKIEDVDLEIEKRVLEHRLGRPASGDELVLYLQHPNDAVSFFKFEEKYGKTWVLPPSVWFRKGGFSLGEKFEFQDAFGKLHKLEIGPQRRTKDGDYITLLVVDHHPEPILTVIEDEGGAKPRAVTLSPKEIEALARSGDIRAPIKGLVNQIPGAVGDAVNTGEILVVLEAMKMLTNITSEVSGKISEIFVSPGSDIEVGDRLMTINMEA
jgi:pyruvate carboxylase